MAMAETVPRGPPPISATTPPARDAAAAAKRYTVMVCISSTMRLALKTISTTPMIFTLPPCLALLFLDLPTLLPPPTFEQTTIILRQCRGTTPLPRGYLRRSGSNCRIGRPSHTLAHCAPCRVTDQPSHSPRCLRHWP